MVCTIERIGSRSAITSFVENPVTNLVKGIALFMIGVSRHLTRSGKTWRTSTFASVMGSSSSGSSVSSEPCHT